MSARGTTKGEGTPEAPFRIGLGHQFMEELPADGEWYQPRGVLDLMRQGAILRGIFDPAGHDCQPCYICDPDAPGERWEAAGVYRDGGDG